MVVEHPVAIRPKVPHHCLEFGNSAAECCFHALKRIAADLPLDKRHHPGHARSHAGMPDDLAVLREEEAQRLETGVAQDLRGER